ncbi:MAG TPA: dihydrolipoamide acetyltransferase family protein [Ktedonobacterales bacterium]|nr:dihydrolipoamide acetyltransferase family protein [Ktedonobacterales bacterium]
MNKVLLPKLGDMEEGQILKWLKQEGDEVKKGEPIAEIETEKTSMEMESFVSGTLRKILVPVGQTVPVGAEIALVGDPNEPLEAAPAAPAATSAPAQGAYPQPDLKPSKASTGPVSNGNGRAAQAPAQTQQPQPVAQAAAQAPAAEGERIFISPIARRIVAEHNLDISRIHGTGPNGRIIREDVESFMREQPAAAQVEAPLPAFVAAPVAPAALPGEEVEAVPLTNMRKTIARRLTASMQQAPHFYLTIDVDMGKAGVLRSQINGFAQTEKEPIKVSFNDLIIKAVARAITRMPEINVSFDGDKLLFKKHINIGMAVALEAGLIVPVIHDADHKGVLEIARESRRLVDAAKNNKLKPDDLQGGTFSVSNLGMFGIEQFTAVINPPESAILAVGAIVPTPVVVDGQVTVRERMKLTLSIDHRAIDGATGARYLQELKRLLEEPMGIVV